MRGHGFTPMIYRMLALGWMGMIFFLSSQPTLPVPEVFSAQDKAEHFMAYAMLGFLVARSFLPSRVESWRRVLLVSLLAALYGISDEFHQSFVLGRDASGWDALADSLGGWIAAQCLYWWDRSQVQNTPFLCSLSSKEGGS